MVFMFAGLFCLHDLLLCAKFISVFDSLNASIP